MKKLVLLLLTVVFLSGCMPYSPDYYPEEDLTVYYMRNAINYEYQEKVAVQIRYSSDRNDSLILRVSQTSDGWMSCDGAYSILEGKFEKVGWNDDTLFILTDDTYYMFDINAYEVPADDNTEPVYELKEYSEEEFASAYPDSASFDWYGH